MQAAVDDVLARIAQFEAEAATLRRENVALRHGLRLRSAKPMPPPVAHAIRHAATTCAAVQPEPQLWTMEAWLRSLGIDRLVAGELKRQMKRLRAVKAVDPVYVRAFLTALGKGPRESALAALNEINFTELIGKALWEGVKRLHEQAEERQSHLLRTQQARQRAYAPHTSVLTTHSAFAEFELQSGGDGGSGAQRSDSSSGSAAPSGQEGAAAAEELVGDDRNGGAAAALVTLSHLGVESLLGPAAVARADEADSKSARPRARTCLSTSGSFTSKGGASTGGEHGEGKEEGEEEEGEEEEELAFDSEASAAAAYAAVLAAAGGTPELSSTAALRAMEAEHASALCTFGCGRCGVQATTARLEWWLVVDPAPDRLRTLIAEDEAKRPGPAEMWDNRQGDIGSIGGTSTPCCARRQRLLSASAGAAQRVAARMRRMPRALRRWTRRCIGSVHCVRRPRSFGFLPPLLRAGRVAWPEQKHQVQGQPRRCQRRMRWTWRYGAL